MSTTHTTVPSRINSKLHQKLTSLAQQDQTLGIKAKFEQTKDRVEAMSHQVGGLYVDFSKTHISTNLTEAYVELAKDCQFTAKRQALFAGEKINVTEERSVLHTLLRDPSNQGILIEDNEVVQQALATREQMVDQYQLIVNDLSSRTIPVTDIVHVGIGGSALGPQLITEALKGDSPSLRVHFIGNIDAHQLIAILANCKVESTLVVGVSKTFTTAETLQNLDSLAAWFRQQGVTKPLDHFYAVTAVPENASKYGISNQNITTFPNWVGGRYSVWSAVSLSAALVFGIDKFKELLDGAAEMDQHFVTASPDQNICFLAAMLDHYYANYMGVCSRAIFAYDYRLRSLVDYLQQLETESNGKDRQIDGSPVDQKTSSVIWGGVGTDVQHSVFQMLHQGTAMIPAEFILVKSPDHAYVEHHRELLANGLAQTAALLAGQTYDEVAYLHASEGLSELAKKAKIFSGNKPSTTFLIEQLTPRALGSLLAFYEHRTFCGGVLANINSYDQMGVELGKRLAKQLRPLLDSGDSEKVQDSDFDNSTKNLIERVLR